MIDWHSSAKWRVTVEQASEIADQYGGQAVSWQPVATVWGAVKPGKGTESIVHEHLQNKQLYIVYIRYLPALDSIDTAGRARIRYNSGKLLNVQAVRAMDSGLKCEGRAFMELVCLAGEPT